MSSENIKIVVTGTRGFPGVQGGIETHCEKLYPVISRYGADVVVLGRAPYLTPGINEFNGVVIEHIRCPKNRSFETLVHTMKCVFRAKALGCDILHMHAIGPSLFAPLARLLGMKVVMTHHGQDYYRSKWGFVGKVVLRLGEAAGCLFANAVICISEHIAGIVKKKFGIKPFVIPNGVPIPELRENDPVLKEFGLEQGRYCLTVGRFVPEKGFDYLIKAFREAGLEGWKLVIVGEADHKSMYSRKMAQMAVDAGAVLTGVLKGDRLAGLYSNAGLFVLPSYHEGLPIVLLEAMSYGLSCLASDIPAHECVGLDKENYFPAGSVESLRDRLRLFARRQIGPDRMRAQIEALRQKYDWEKIAGSTMEVYRSVLKKGR